MSYIKCTVAFWMVIFAFNCFSQTNIVGSGSTLAYPVMQDLIKEYKEQKKIELTYSSVGSGEGIRNISARSVNFSLSEIPLSQYDLTSQDLIQFPVFASAIVPVLNIPGVDANHMVITASALADIYLGKIARWDDPILHDLNPKINLPALPIKVIYRADESGSSYAFTSFLSRSNVNWNTKHGIGSKLKWPIGQGVVGGNGVVRALQLTEGGIGYVEYGAAINAKLNIPLLRVQGQSIIANHQSFAESFDVLSPIRPSFYKFTTPSPSLGSGWPIMVITNALLPKHPVNDEDMMKILNFFYWVYQSGGGIMKAFNLLPIENKKAISSVESQWKTITNAKGKSLWLISDTVH